METFVEVDGAQLHVKQEGEGVPVLVPTGGGTDFYQNSLSDALKRRLRLIYVEMRGTGQSSGHIEGASFASLADDLESVRAGLGLEDVIVLGHSNHGCIALEHALRHPERVSGVISVASAPDFSRAFTLGQERWEERADPGARKRLEDLQGKLGGTDEALTAADEYMFRRYLSLTPLGWRDWNFDPSGLWGEPPTGMAVYFGWLFKAGSRWDATSRLGEIEAPLLAVSGRHDYLCPAELWEGAIGRVKRGELVVFEESAHNPQWEQQEEFDRVVLRFVERAWASR